MFERKRKTGQYKFLYGKSPVLESSFSKQGFHTQVKPAKRPHPLLKKIKRYGIFISIVAVCIFVVYGVFFSNYFKITTIDLKNKEIETQNVAEKIKNSISKAMGGNIIFTDTKALEAKVLSTFPELEKVTISKSYPHALLIDFGEYPLVANLINESATVKKSYILNAVGFAVKENYEDKTLPYIRIKSEEPINTKTAIIDTSKLTYILNAIKYFEDKFGMKVTEALYKPIAREVHLLTQRNFYIWLDIQRPAEDQLKKLKKALVKLNIYKDNFAYIDLRIAGNNSDKIIYKRR